MIGPHDRIALPDGVRPLGGGLHDHVRGCTIPVSGTGLEAVAGTSTPRGAARSLAARFAVDEGRVLRDVLLFCAQLNERLLLNVAPRGGAPVLAARWLRCVPLALPFGLPALPRRRWAIDTGSLCAIVRSAAPPLGRSTVRLLALGALVATVVLAAVGARSPALGAVVAGAAAAAVVVHELGHLVALRGVPACVVTRGLRVVVLHRPASRSRTRLVAAAGPAAGLALAAFALPAAVAMPSPESAAFALVPLVNALGLTTLTGDGRTLCGLS